MNFTTDELSEVETDILENIEEYIKNEVLHISSPQFYHYLISDITDVFHDYWVDCGFCDEDDYDEVQTIVENLLDVYFDFSIIPRRSHSYHCLVENSKNVDDVCKQIDKLKNIPQPKQKTPEWHEFRYNLITASNIWKAVSSDAQRNSLIYEKCKPLNMNQLNNNGSNTESAFHWGIKYEQVTVLIYEHMFQTKLYDFGCIRHPVYEFIGASPDGINCDFTNEQRYGRMLEIKNIVNREITGIPKEEYWIQTQIQMETCDLDDCDFVETRFKEFENEDDFYKDQEHEYKGVVLHFIVKTLNMTQQQITENLANINNPVYKYMPVDVSCDKETIGLWIDREKEMSPHLTLFKVDYWYLDEFSCVLIERNRLWFQSALPIIRETWNTILEERKNGYEHRASKKRIPKTEPKLIVEKNGELFSQQIHNMPITNSICLIKLEAYE